MRRDTVEQYLGKYVEVVLFDGDTLKGILQKTGTDRYKNEPDLYLKKNYYVLENEFNRYDYSCLFRSSHIKKIKLKIMMNKIAIMENGILKYKEVTESDLLLLQNEIEKNVKFHHFHFVNKDKIKVSIEKDNHGHVIIAYREYVTTTSISDICSANFGEDELSNKEAIALNLNLMLDNLDEIVFRDNK